MGKNALLQYYVEGECEQNFLHAFMHAEPTTSSVPEESVPETSSAE